MSLPFPKPRRRRRPGLADRPPVLASLARLLPDEVRAMGRIAELADLVHVAGRPYLVVPADAFLLDTLAAFGASLEDAEPDCIAEDGDPREDDDADEEPGGGVGLTLPPEGARKSCEAFADRRRAEARAGLFGGRLYYDDRRCLWVDRELGEPGGAMPAELFFEGPEPPTQAAVAARLAEGRP